MKRHMELVLLILTDVFLFSVILWFWSPPGTMVNLITSFTGAFSALTACLYYIVASSLIEYYGLCGVGKMLYRQNKLTKRGVRQLNHVRGSLEKVCNEINKRHEPGRYLIVDDELNPAGVFEGGKWRAK